MKTVQLKIGDVAKQAGVSVPTLRYYETLGLITSSERGDNGYRSIWMIIEQNIKCLENLRCFQAKSMMNRLRSCLSTVLQYVK